MKKLFLKIISPVKKIFSKYPVTIVLTYILTAFIALTFDTDIIDNETISQIIFFLFTWCAGVFFVENYVKNKKNFLGVIITFVISTIFYILSYILMVEDLIFLKIYITYLSGIIIFSLYKIISDSKLDLKDYMLKTFTNMFYVSVIYFVLNIGIVVLSSIFITLILDGEGFYWLVRLLILLFGMFYVPAIINSLVNVEIEESKFFKKLLLYVLLPLVVFASLIIYLYIIKLFVNGDVVKNEIFVILALIFVVNFPICVMARNYNKIKLVDKITKIMMFSYIFFIVLQMYAMNLRVSQYGLTEYRYLAYWFVLIEAITIVLFLYKDLKYMKSILLVLFAISAVLNLTPFTPERVSALSQKKILDEFVDKDINFDECTKKEKLKYSGAYNYLSKSYYDEYINENLTVDDVSKMNDYIWIGYYDEEDYDDDYEFSKVECIYLYSSSLEGLDISKYTKIYDIKSIEEDIDINEYAQRIVKIYLENGKYKTERYFAQNYIIEFDEYDVLLSSISIKYYVETEEITFLRYNGYVLEK